MIIVFKTSVAGACEVERLTPQLNAMLGPSAWNFDLQDCDHILRINSTPDRTRAIIALLEQNSFDCEELED